MGGMSTVYEARDLNFANAVRLCAIKEIAAGSTQSLAQGEQRQVFEREVSLLASLNHPAIPKIYDFFSDGDFSYLILELIRGRDLESLLREQGGPLPPAAVVHWAVEICDVLHYLHTRTPAPIVFRDMKPSNVMLNEHDHVVLVDFGIAKIFRGEQRGTMIGTEGYAPPEQYRGIATPRGDIYALGATMHHLLTGADPTGEAPFTFHERPIQRYNPAVSSELVALVERALSYEMEDRYSSAGEMREALSAVPEARGRTGRAGGISSPARHQDVEPLWVFECEDEIRSSPRADRGVVWIGCYDNNIYALQRENGRLVWKFPTEGGIAGTPTPWEDLVLVGSEDFSIYAINAGSGRQVWEVQTQGKVRSSVRIAYDHAFVGSDDGFIYALHARTGRQVWKAPTAGPVRSTPALGDETLFVGSEDGYLYAMHLLRGSLIWRYYCGSEVTSSPLLMEGMVIVGSTDRYVYALDRSSGWPVWRYRTEKPIVSSPACSENSVFIGSADANLYALDAGSGRLLWKFQTEGQVNSSPCVYQGAVYVGSADGALYALDARTGKLRWRFQTDGPVISSPCVFDKVVYIGSLDHSLYALPA